MKSNNLVAAFDNRRDALDLVLNGIERNGAADTLSFALEIEDEQGDGAPVAQGELLEALAQGEP